MLELNAICIEYDYISKFTVIKFSGFSNVKFYLRTQLSRFYKYTGKMDSLSLLDIITKWKHFLPKED